jgi:hypothetical protein
MLLDVMKFRAHVFRKKWIRWNEFQFMLQFVNVNNIGTKIPAPPKKHLEM